MLGGLISILAKLQRSMWLISTLAVMGHKGLRGQMMNQSDIEWAYSRTHDCPNVRRGISLLYQLMLAVNAQSDGWAYWAAASRSANKLIELLNQVNFHFETFWNCFNNKISSSNIGKLYGNFDVIVNS